MKTTALLASVLSFCTWTCVSLHAGQQQATVRYADIYQRATNELAEAEFFKPAEAKTNDLTYLLAPLILQQVNRATERLARLDRFGSLSLSNGVLTLDRERPVVYWQADTVQLAGRGRLRFSYVWCYEPHLAPLGARNPV